MHVPMKGKPSPHILVSILYLLCRLDRHMAVLRRNFALVGQVQEGEGGEEEEDEEEGEGDGKLIKESDDTYSIWASGRINCEGFLAQIKVCFPEHAYM